MKKSIVLAMCMALPVMAGEIAPIATPVMPAPVIAPAPSCSLALEVGPTYTLACEDLAPYVDGADMLGMDVTALYNLTENWAITLRGGWARGEGDTPWGFDVDVETLSLMPGVRYTAPISDKLGVFVGANAGVAHLHAKLDEVNVSERGFCYSVETGLKYDICESTYLYGAVNLSGSEASPSNLDDQLGVGFRVGVGFSF